MEESCLSGVVEAEKENFGVLVVKAWERECERNPRGGGLWGILGILGALYTHLDSPEHCTTNPRETWLCIRRAGATFTSSNVLCGHPVPWRNAVLNVHFVRDSFRSSR